MQPPNKLSPGAHIPALDGLRGVAILLVLLHQFNRLGGHDLATRVAEYALDFGWIGVQLFFVLSGFLITGILLDSREAPNYLRSFFARRVLRIFPLYFGALVVFLVLLPRLGLAPPGWGDHQLWYWLYLSNWTGAYVDGPLPHFWSLAVEEQFYLVWPFVVLAFGVRPLLRICIALSIASLGIRAAMVAMGVLPEAIYMFSTSRIDALLLGGGAAAILRLPADAFPRLRNSRTLWRVAAGLGLAGFVLTRAYPRTSPLGQTLGYSILAVVFAMAILAIAVDARPADGVAGRILTWGPLRRLGLYSYGMYVFHKPLHDLVGKPVLESLGLGRQMGMVPGLAYVAAAGLVTLAAGALSYHLFERYFLALKPRFGAAPPDPTA